MNACEKYYWIKDHPAFINPSPIEVEFEIDPHMVCPLTNRIEEYQPLNTKHRLWVEMLIPSYNSHDDKWEHAHDWELDTGGDTWEEMIENLYDLVVEKYGFYTEEEYDAKFDEVHRIKAATINSKSRKLTVRWNLTFGDQSWKDDILSDTEIETYTEEMKDVIGTINALTEHRKTCSMSEYKAVDEELEKNQFILFEQQLSLQTGIDLVRK